MVCIDNTSTDPYFNLAAEEYLFSTFTDNIFMLWQNAPSVIIGKHQDVWSEVNMDLADAMQLKVARRFSGGGTVYHDLGNLNFTFIENNERADFSKFSGQIIRLLDSFGIHAIPDARLGLTVNGLKISGSAQYIRKGRIMHHATLLFSSDLELLGKVLDSPQKHPAGQSPRYSVPSVKSPVANLSTFLPTYMPIDRFKQKIISHFCGNKQAGSSYSFTENDRAAIKRLRDEKYAKTEWNINPHSL